MLDLDDDMAVFIDPAGFGVHCTRSRLGEDDAAFVGILSTTDEPQFDGQALLPKHRLHFPTAAADVRPGDEIVTVASTQAGIEQPAQRWRAVRSPERMVDGQQSVVYLKALAEF